MQQPYPYGAVPYSAQGHGRSVASLQGELTETQRRLGEVTQENNVLRVRLGELEGVLRGLSSQSAQLDTLQRESSVLQDETGRLRKENVVLKDSLQKAEGALQDERQKRERAEVSAAQAEADRNRQQRAREELAAQLRLAEQRARDAEEEQCKAEADAANLRRELRAGHAGSGAENSSDDAAAMELHQLKQELEIERGQTDGLVAALDRSRAETRNANAELSKAVDKVKQLENALSEQHKLQSAPEPEPEPSSEISMAPVAAASTPHSYAPSSIASDFYAEEAELKAQVAKLLAKVNAMKNSRDKLLFEVDRQSVEVEALQAEMLAVKQELADGRKLSQHWEHQCRLSVGQIDKLKDLLEESAKWSPGIGDREEAVGRPDGGNQLMEEQAVVAALEHKVRELDMHLVKTAQDNVQLKRSWLPVLHGIESRLMQLASSASDVID